jgi:hypothetical protein
MTIEDRLNALARQGRGETVPEVEVADRVVRLLTVQPSLPAALPDRLWMWMAGLSCAAAAAVLVVAVVPFYGVVADPLVEVMETISWVIQ